jgi:HK97 family phage major capsid protein
VRGVAATLDATLLSDDAAGVNPPSPAGLLSAAYTLPVVEGAVDIPAIITGVGAIEGAGGLADVAFVNPADLTAIRLAVVTGGFSISDPTAPGVERIAGARLIGTSAMAAGHALIADTRFLVGAIRQDAQVEFSGDAAFTSDATLARVVMRVDLKPSDTAALYLIQPEPTP